MKQTTRILPFLVLACLHSAATAAGVFTVSGRDILLDGSVFETRGICYQPTPIGESGAQFPFGDYYTFSTRNQAIWDRDFANFRKMGANVIRLYGWTLGADHSAFLSQAYNGGTDSIYVLINRYIDPGTDWNNPAAVDGLIAEWEAMATELADNPAIMGFLVGNEVNAKFNGNIGMVNGDSVLFWDAMEQISSAVKTIAPNKLVSVAITDRLDQVATFDTAMGILDFWAMQLYRGSSFNSLFTDYPAASAKPLVITEFGYDALDGRTDTEWPDNGKIPADAMENLLTELRQDDALLDVVAGVCVFEYADEWWKDQDAGNLNDQDFGPRWTGPFIDGQGNEEWWGIFRIKDNGSDIDLLEPRAMFYRIAAMWNPPFETVMRAQVTGDNLTVSFTYPVHLRDQRLELKMSDDLENWTTVASNTNSTFLNSFNSSLLVNSESTDAEVQVTAVKELGSTGVQQLLANGDFELGTTDGWDTGGAIVSTNPQAGSSALELSASGGFSVPLATQTFPASPGDEFNLSGYMYATAPLPANATFGLLKIVFRDINGTDLEPASVSVGQRGPAADPGGESQPFLNSASPVQEWIYTEAQAVAPEGTESVVFLILNVDESAATMVFDSVSAVPVNGSAGGGPQVYFRLQNLGR